MGGAAATGIRPRDRLIAAVCAAQRLLIAVTALRGSPGPAPGREE